VGLVYERPGRIVIVRLWYEKTRRFELGVENEDAWFGLVLFIKIRKQKDEREDFILLLLAPSTENRRS
jgi:hypothetical protein